MEFCLNGDVTTPKERNLLIRYCLSVATRAKCSTKALLRPFRQRDLKIAFEEQQREHLSRIREYEARQAGYDPETAQLSQWFLDYFGGVPTKETFSRYCREIVKQESGVLRGLKRNYSVYVDYEFLGRKWLSFHRSLSPRVTFGYSNCLHEECDFFLNDEKRAAFLSSSLAELPQWKGDWIHDWGNVMFGNMQLFYEDLALFRGETCILETISHERSMTVWLDEDDLSALSKLRGGKKLTGKLKTL